MRAALLVATFCVASARQSLPREAPIASFFAPQYLDGTWALFGANRSLSASVPGDLISDLAAAGAIPRDPLFENSFLPPPTGGPPLWDADNWTYSVLFVLADPTAAHTLLVFDGVKMAADVYLNGALVGSTDNQFRRYYWPVTSALRRDAGAKQELAVVFPRFADARNAGARWAACSGGWDCEDDALPVPATCRERARAHDHNSLTPLRSACAIQGRPTRAPTATTATRRAARGARASGAPCTSWAWSAPRCSR